uniref:Preproalbumin PawS1 n=1 Tax=Tilesia baccata TaxID=183091 RepID=A0A023GYJ0_TILBA|nr:preproalbumin PawS1 [Tilesia baccata]
MAKLAVLVVVLAVMVTFVEVSGYRTTIATFTVEDNGDCHWIPAPPFFMCTPDGLDDNRKGSREQCDKKQISIQQLNHCEMHLTSSSSFDYKLMMAVENPQQEEHLSLCCNQLRQVEEKCQCEAIKQVVEQAQKQQQQGGRQGQKMMREQMRKKAQMLPNQCNLKCSI